MSKRNTKSRGTYIASFPNTSTATSTATATTTTPATAKTTTTATVTTTTATTTTTIIIIIIIMIVVKMMNMTIQDPRMETKLMDNCREIIFLAIPCWKILNTYYAGKNERPRERNSQQATDRWGLCRTDHVQH